MVEYIYLSLKYILKYILKTNIYIVVYITIYKMKLTIYTKGKARIINIDYSEEFASIIMYYLVIYKQMKIELKENNIVLRDIRS